MPERRAHASVLLKRLAPTEARWLAGAEEERRGPRLDARVVGDLFAGEDASDVRVRWHDGLGIREALRRLEPERGTGRRLSGEGLGGSRLRASAEGDLLVLRLEQALDVTGARRWRLTLDVGSQSDLRDEELAELVRAELGDATAVLLPEGAAERALAAARRRLPAFGGGRSWEVDDLSEREWALVHSWLLAHVRVEGLHALLEARAGAQVDAILGLVGEGGPAPTAASLASAVIRRHGTDLLAAAARRELLLGERFRDPSRRPRLPELWTRGGRAARRFAAALGLPEVMAGRAAPVPSDVEEVLAFPPLDPLHDYQRQIARGLRESLHASDWRERRAVAWLPTGTGKTRVCVETLLVECFLAPPRNALVWIADREELCEQAIESFRHVWMVLGHRTPTARGAAGANLRVVRLWGGRPWQALTAAPTLVVASVQTLAARAKRREHALRLGELAERCTAVVFDEAHHVVAPSYRRVIRALGLSRKPNVLGNTRETGPTLFGLTATPARTSRDETELLAERFGGRLLEPDEPYRAIRGFITRGYLARPRLEVVRTGYRLEQLERDAEEWTSERRLAGRTLRRTGSDPLRNAAILRDLEPRLAELRSVLVFACSIEHAETLAEVLSRRGHRALALHGGSPRSQRQSAIRRFREGALQVLVTCDLLTTGFDAPNVDAVVLARPVESRVLFAQMVGRGLRGPRNGGTARCLILDYEDAIGDYDNLDLLRQDFRQAFVGDGEALEERE